MVAFASHLPSQTFNGVLVLDDPGPDAGDASLALDWVTTRDVPFTLWVRGDLLPKIEGVVERSGLEPEPDPTPGMVMRPVSAAPAPPPGVAVRQVTDAASLIEHVEVLASGGFPGGVARRLLPPSMLHDADVALFTGFLDGRPVATSLAIRSGSVAGIYNVGTHRGARRRGVGATVSWAAVDAGRRWGCTMVVLQSSRMGESVYRSMGFRTIVEYRLYGPQEDP